MTWVRLDDGFFQNPKARAVGKDGRALFLAGLCYCARLLTDGRIPRGELKLIAAEAEVSPRVEGRLVAAGLWVVDGDEFVVPDFTALNPSRAKVEADRATAKARQRRLRSRHGAGNAVTNAVGNGDGHGVENGVGSPLPPTPKTSHTSSDQPGYPAAFEQWWCVYPRHEAKLGALRKWETARKLVDDQVLLSAAGRYAEHHRARGTELRYIAHPATWLHQGRWDDQLGVPEPASMDPSVARQAAADQIAHRLPCDRCDSSGWVDGGDGSVIRCPDCTPAAG